MRRAFSVRSCAILCGIALLGLGGPSDARPVPPPALPPPADGTPFASAEEYMAQPNFGVGEDGILYRDYGRSYGGLGRFRNPLFIAHYAQALYRDFVASGDETKKAAFLMQAAYLSDTLESRGKFSVWTYPMENPDFGAKPGWAAGLTQGVALTVLLRAHALTQNPSYADAAERVLKAFQVETTKGGVRTSLPKGAAFYQEVSDREATPGFVLNGHIGALIGLYDYWKNGGSRTARMLFEQGAAGVAALLPQYLTGPGCSLYSLQPILLAPLGNYNVFHVYMLLWLFKVTNDRSVLEAALRTMSFEQRSYKASVSSSTDPVSFGPENLYLQLGSTAWSSNRLPADVTLDLGRTMRVRALRAVSINRDSAVPRDYRIILEPPPTMTGEPFVLPVTGNTAHIRDHELGDRLARRIRFRIDQDNGNNNVVLNGFGLEPSPGWRAPTAVSDVDNFSSQNLPFQTLDNNPASVWLVRRAGGWLLIDYSRPRTLWSLTVTTDIARRPLAFSVSDDLKTWKPLVSTPGDPGVTVAWRLPGVSARYVRMEVAAGETPLMVREVTVNADDLPFKNFEDLFTAFDARVNDGAGYSLRHNDEGRATGALLAWSESYLQRAYVELYWATHGAQYLVKAAAHIRNVLAQRDDRRPRADYLGRLLPEWGTSRYDPQQRWRAYAVLDAMILLPMLEFVVAAQPASGDLGEMAATALRDAEATAAAWEADWRTGLHDTGWYVWQEVYDATPGQPLPLDMQAALGRCHVLLARLTGREEYRKKAAQLLETVKRSLKPGKGDILVWGVPPGLRARNAPVADTGHGAIVAEFLAMARDAGYAVPDKTMTALVKTVAACLKEGRMRGFIDGTGPFIEDPLAALYTELIRYGPDLDDQITRALCQSIPLESSMATLPEDWWGVGMLGLARLGAMAKERRPDFSLLPIVETPKPRPAALASVTAMPVSLIANGGFEEQDPSDPPLPLGWTREQATADTARTAEREDGGQVAVLRGDPAARLWQYLAQSLPNLEPGRHYELAFDAKTYRGAGGILTIVLIGAGGVTTRLGQVQFSNAEWESHTLAFGVPPDLAGRVRILLSVADYRDAMAVVAFDNLRMKEVPG